MTVAGRLKYENLALANKTFGASFRQLLNGE